MDVVRAQVAKTLEHHLRPDGSVYHVYKFDPATGDGAGGDTYQGLCARKLMVARSGLGDHGSRDPCGDDRAIRTTRRPANALPTIS